MTTAEEKYKRIINKLWRSEIESSDPDFFCRHPPMALLDRAKIFAPFAALRGHGERLTQETGKLLRCRRIELSEEESGILSDKLLQIKRGMKVTVTCFSPDKDSSDTGCYLSFTGIVDVIDPIYRFLKINTGEETEKGVIVKTVRFDDLLDINGDDIVDADRLLADSFSDRFDR